MIHIYLIPIAEMNEKRIRIAIDDPEALIFNIRTRKSQYPMSNAGNGPCQARIVETTTRAAQNAIKRIHDNLYGLRKCGVFNLLCFLTFLPEILDKQW